MNKQIIFGSIAAIFVIVLLCFLMCDGSNGQSSDTDKTENNKKEFSKELLEQEYASGVVLIYNSTYYSITFKDLITMYFSGVDDEDDIIGLTYDEEEVEPIVSSGTGFFITQDGKIATNSHVAADVVDQSHIRSLIINSLASELDEFKDQINNLNENIATLNVLYQNDHSSQTRKEINKLKEERDALQKTINIGDRINAAEYSVSIHSQNYIALHNTYITNQNDLKGCQILKNDPENDLAIIQLSDKKTPDGRHVFELDDSGEISVNETLYMIGYNKGPLLAETSVGIKAQITEGGLGQDRGDSFIHTIPATTGSSGSPILNKAGLVVGVNYASLKADTSFKFGVKAKILKKLMEES